MNTISLYDFTLSCETLLDKIRKTGIPVIITDKGVQLLEIRPLPLSYNSADNKEIQRAEFEKLLEEGYKSDRNEDNSVTDEFQFADSEGWDEY